MSPSPTLTLDEFWLQYGYKPYELLDGQVAPLRKLSFQHSIILLRVTTMLEQYVVEHGLGEVIGTNSGFALNATTLRSPRAAFISQERWESVRYPYNYFPFPPDIAIELAEADEDTAALRPMLRDYLQAGSKQVWILYPDNQQIAVYVPGKYRIFQHEDDLLGGQVIPGLRMPVASLFPRSRHS